MFYALGKKSGFNTETSGAPIDRFKVWPFKRQLYGTYYFRTDVESLFCVLPTIFKMRFYFFPLS